MSASAPEPVRCAACGTDLPAGSRYCPGCGAAIDARTGETQAYELPANETGPVPIAYDTVQPRYFGVAPAVVLLVVTLLFVVLALVLFINGHWPIGLIVLGLALLCAVAFAEVARRKPDTAVSRVSAEALRDFRLRSASALEAVAARGRAGRDTLRIRRELARLGGQRLERLAALGDAVYRGDPVGTRQARARVAEVDARAAQLERELHEGLLAAQERIRKARLQVQPTQMVQVPEPYPPPDEGTIPQPDPVPTPLGPEPSPGPPAPDPVPTPLGPDQPAEPLPPG